MLSTESHLTLLDTVVCNLEGLCEGELCSFRHRRKVSALCLLYEIYRRADHPLPEYFPILLHLVILEVHLLCVS